MAYSFEPQESLANGVRRIAREELESAIENLHGSDADRDARVLEIRKSLKKLRAPARLFRAELGAAAFEHENVALREIGRKLSAARDTAALAGAIDRTAEQLGDRARPLQDLRAKLLEPQLGAESAQLTPERSEERRVGEE